MFFNTRSFPLRKAKSDDANDSEFPARTPRAYRPDWETVHSLTEGEVGPGSVVIYPFGVGDANDVFEIRITLWKLAKLSGQILWLPVPLTIDPFVCTLGTQTGVAGSSFVTNGHKFCDTITNADTNIASFGTAITILSPADNSIAYITAPTYGAPMFEILWKTSTGDPTGMNCLFQLL